MTLIEARLREALAVSLNGLPLRQAITAVERLKGAYRGTTPTHTPVLRDRSDVVAYAAYRMPATFEAARAALGAFADRVPGWAPARHVDLGGGTGAATWAVADVWGGGTASTVLDWAEPALELGRELAADALPGTDWRRDRITGSLQLPEADLVTLSYVLGELTGADRAAAVAAAARAADAVAVVEPGTPEGYLRVLAARDALVADGFRVVAPCPHSGTCPLVPGEDWCHFAARVARSSLHRQVKGGALSHEDEKFSYVAAVRTPAPEAESEAGKASGPASGQEEPAAARIVRRPQIRKGQVLLDLCEPDGVVRRAVVSKRHGPRYRAARDADWGDEWMAGPPDEPSGGPPGER
ncbi:small ribosomal subunit Rsm22 family protein [Streptomyces sp. 549]|uniref:small ribosomal subunit Rsm22 family protein n=1 Tax=Streptomyces sp. 549 TaxID=3049076 RepID=UPI0024C2FF5C|nr:small ribosomal subunit Rsm22 family protein [Streptomyces sp. 549]MDK1474039.1 small ribosomal subunit Rsm22 family protein [Streptomyces sp. 549]